jgi:hypothetical protein
MSDQAYGEGSAQDVGHSPSMQSHSQPTPLKQGGWNGLAITSLVLGIVWVYAIGSILAVVFGHIALHQIKARPGQKGKRLAIAGLILGYLGFAFMALLIVAALAGSGTNGYYGG